MYLVVEWTTMSAPRDKRVLEVRRGEGVVDGDDRAPLVRHLRELRYVREGQHRVGRRLDPEQLRLWPERPLDGGRVRGVGVGEVEAARAGEDLVEESVRSAVEVVAGDDVVARREQAHHRGRRGEPGGEGEAVTRRLRGLPRTLRGPCGSGFPTCCTRSPCVGPALPACRSRSGRWGLSWPPSRGRGPGPRVWRAWRTRCLRSPAHAPSPKTR